MTKLKERLKQTSPNLNEIYKRILQEIDLKNREKVSKLLKIIRRVRRSLLVTELEYALDYASEHIRLP
jgi:hypothetical protein